MKRKFVFPLVDIWTLEDELLLLDSLTTTRTYEFEGWGDFDD